tara:strand:+ start:5958 stop:7625 length:1668 start_codon:yes stop_codon:yes gene_type:complete
MPITPPPLPDESGSAQPGRWRSNLGFLVLIVLGVVVMLGTIWEPRTVQPPESFDPQSRGDASIQATAGKVDQAIAQTWATAEVEPVSRADDLAIVRRLSLGLIGTIPSFEEIRAIEAVPESRRIDWWLAHLFEDPRYGDYVAERFARAYVGTDAGPLLVYRRRRMVNWLAEEFRANRPYDELVRSLIAAEGVWTSNPAANFLTRTIENGNKDKGPDEVELAARMTRAFLGVRIDCMQCHDDKLGDRWKQADFHQLAAFFAQAENGLTGIRDNQKVSYSYRYRGSREEAPVSAVVPFQPEIFPEEGALRERLAIWTTHPENKAFARTTVNRVWAILFGKALVEPVDDIPLDGELPDALDLLADDLIANQFDLQRLIRVIASTEAYQLDSRSEDPKLEDVWASYPLTRLRPEQVAQSVIQASSLTTINREAHIIQRMKRFGETNDFVKRYGDLGEEEFLDQGGTIPQRLLLMNGKLLDERTEDNIVMNAATRIGALAGSDQKAVETAYLSIFTRRPTSEELTHFVGTLRDKKSKARNNAMQDLFWALMNATEFSWNH